MIPKQLKGILWSRKIENLSLKLDQEYIIHQVLIYGTLADWKWLFKTYGFSKVKEIFVKKPLKIYSPVAFNFVKKVLFGIPGKLISQSKYDQTTLRRIG